MANERRVRGNYSFGTVPGGLGVADTLISSAGLAGLPAIDATSYAAITLFNPAVGAYEIVYVTSHAAAATVATIARGQEGTAAQGWAPNTAWTHGPTAADLTSGIGIDAPWGGNLGYDSEFDRNGQNASLPSGWSWFNQGGASLSEEYGAARLALPGLAAFNCCGITRSIPAGGAWNSITAKISGANGPGNYCMIGMFVKRAAAAPLVSIVQANAAAVNIEVMNWSSATVQTAAQADVAWGGPLYTILPMYMQVVRVSATAYAWNFSTDGLAWYTANTVNTPSFLGGEPDTVGIFGAMNNSKSAAVCCHWLRVR